MSCMSKEEEGISQWSFGVKEHQFVKLFDLCEMRFHESTSCSWIEDSTGAHLFPSLGRYARSMGASRLDRRPGEGLESPSKSNSLN